MGEIGSPSAGTNGETVGLRVEDADVAVILASEDLEQGVGSHHRREEECQVML